MTPKTLYRLASGSMLAIALLFISPIPASAQTECTAAKVSVKGFPAKRGDETVITDKTTANLGDWITVQIEVIPCPPAKTTANTTTQPPPAGGTKPTGTAATPGKDQALPPTGSRLPAPDGTNPVTPPAPPLPSDQSWIPGLKQSDLWLLVPYLNARQLKGVYPTAIDPQNHMLTFHLSRTEASKQAWRDLLSKPDFTERKMSFSVGLEDKEQFPTSAILSLVVMQWQWFLLAAAVFLLVLYIFFRLAASTPIIRDGGITKGGIPKVSVLWKRNPAGVELAPFSLARSQMAFWFFMVISAFVLIWLIIGDTDTVTSGMLVLIGISAGTALGSTAIDSSSEDPPSAEKSRGFINDILSDGKGISFHRFQIVIWTIVLGFVFVRNVIGHLAMPDFGTTLLTLMGISSGTYLGMKLPEKPPGT